MIIRRHPGRSIGRPDPRWPVVGLPAPQGCEETARGVRLPGGWARTLAVTSYPRAMTVRPIWQGGQLIDLPGQLAATAEHAGLIPFERNVALLAALRQTRIVAHPSFFQLEHIRQARATGLPRQLISHEDFLAFHAPATATQDSIRKDGR